MASQTDKPAIGPVLVRQHVERAATLLAEHDADGLLVFRDSNILAFCGVPLGPSDRLVCGLLSRGGKIAFVVPAFEESAARDLPAGSEIVSWTESQDPFAAVAFAANKLGISSGTILLDGHTWLNCEARLNGSMNGATLRRDPGVIESIRMIKSAEEVETVRAACRDTGQIYPIVTELLRPGLREDELARAALNRLRERGLSPHGDLIQGGENAAIPHKPTGSRAFRDGDAVIVDFSCAHGSYLGDMTRTFAVGSVSEEVRRAYAVVRHAQRAAIEAIRPGVACGHVDGVARRIIADAGLGEYFVHRLGHGIGLDIHEPPYLVQGNKLPLAPGMCVTVEPGVYVPGRFGIRIEDVVAVTADGCEVLSSDVPTDVSAAFQC